MRSFGVSIGFALLAIRASATPLVNITNLVGRDTATLNLFTDTECKVFLNTIVNNNVEPGQNSGCLRPAQPIGSISLAGDYLYFKLWVDEYCLEEQSLISDGGGCYAFYDYTTADGYSFTS